jgi:hypothetical protein
MTISLDYTAAAKALALVFNQIFGRYIADFVHALAAPTTSLLQIYLLATKDAVNGGDFTATPVIAEFEPIVSIAADTGLVAVAVWGAYRLMFGHGVRTRYTVRILLPRLAVAAFLIQFSQLLFQIAVDFTNALDQAVTGTQTTQAFGLPDARWWEAILGKSEAEVLILLVLLAGYGVLALAYTVRYALLVLLAITAPLAALLFILPETHHYARKWGSLLVSSLFMQPLQLLILAVALRLETTAGFFPVQHLYPLAALWLCLKVPGALHDTSTIAGRAMTQAKHVAHAVTHTTGRHPSHA